MNYSILFPKKELNKNLKSKDSIAKPYFVDLGIDLIINPIIELKKEYNLEEYYYEPLQDINIITYRQGVMQDLENMQLRKIVTNFSSEVYSIRNKMNKVRKDLSSNDKWSNNYLIRGYMLDYSEKYCHAITKLKEELSEVTIHSQGLLDLMVYINEYIDSESYKDFTMTVNHLRKEFSNIEYSMMIDYGTIKVRKYEGQKDYAKNISETFDKFRQGDVKDYRHDLSEKPEADHVEVAILDLLSGLYEDIFNQLSDFSAEFSNFDDETIIRFSKEIQFYISWLDYIQPLKEIDLRFNYPKLNNNAEHLYGYECFDLALAKQIRAKTITNDFTIKHPESIIVVTGPNQGGKTTYAKMFGQMNYFASLGLSVPGKKSSLFIFDNIYTHFGKEEDLSTQDGKLKDDLERLLDITSQATDKSLVIINEIFSSTTLTDAMFLGNRMMERLVNINAPTVIVTFIDELALYSEATVSMMSTVKEEDPTIRTYKIVRKPPDGSAYAIHIASKHGLTYEKLSRRLSK